jgi:hypothetical protein
MDTILSVNCVEVNISHQKNQDKNNKRLREWNRLKTTGLRKKILKQTLAKPKW